jgi:hypothetical protein
MTSSKLYSAIAAAFAIAASAPASASIVGWFDRLTISMVDTAEGWVCDNWSPTQTPLDGVLSVYVDGSFVRDYALNSNTWGMQRTDAASQCNGYAYVGFSLFDWFDVPVNHSMTIYFKDNSGTLHQLGYPITVTNSPGQNP